MAGSYIKFFIYVSPGKGGKAKLQQDEQHQNQADLEQLDNNCLFSVNHEYYR